MKKDLMHADFISFLMFITRPFLTSLYLVYAVTHAGTEPQLLLISLLSSDSGNGNRQSAIDDDTATAVAV
jgi:hypothetical protein